MAESTGQNSTSLGEIIGAGLGGPLGAKIGKYIGEQVGSYSGDKKEEEQQSENQDSDEQKKKGGNCSNSTDGEGENQTSDEQSNDEEEEKKKTPRYALWIDENDTPENWWDKLPDFDPRVYDAIAMEQASACVKYIFDGLPDIHELETMMEARKNRKNCARLKTNVPRTKIVKPKEIKYNTTIDSWLTKDATY